MRVQDQDSCVTRRLFCQLEGMAVWAYFHDRTIVEAWHTNKAHLCGSVCNSCAAIRHVHLNILQ